MGVAVNHQFVSAKADGADPTQVQPSNWNAALAVTQTAAGVWGATSAGATGLLDAAGLQAFAGVYSTSQVDTALAGKLSIASNLSDLASASTARTNLGLGTAALLASTAVLQAANNLSELASAATARVNLGLATVAASASASDLTSGTLAAARGGAGTITGALKGSGAGVVSQAAASDLSNGVTGSGAVALATSPTFVTPALGTPASGVATNLTGTAAGLTAGLASAWANGRTLSITGDLTYTSPALDGSGNVTAAGTLATVNANVGSFGDATHVAAITVDAKGRITAASAVAITGGGGGTPGGSSGQIQYNNAGAFGGITTTGSGNAVLATSPTLVTPALGTPASGVATNLTGLPLTTGVTGVLPAANGGAGAITGALKANGSGLVSQAGASDLSNGVTGSGAVALATSPTFVTPALGTPASGVATNLTGTASGLTAGNSNQLGGATFAAPGAIGGTTPAAGAFTTATLKGAGQTTLSINYSDATPRIQFGTYSGASTYAALWFGNITPSTTNYSFLGDGTDVCLNAGSTSNNVILRLGNTDNVFVVNTSALKVKAAAALSWVSSADALLGTADTGLSRISAGVVGVGTGAQGSVAGAISASAFLAPSYLGQVATGCSVPYAINTGTKFANGRRPHYARDAITALQIAFPTYYVTGGVETALTGNTTITASIEYPSGTFTQVKWAGSATKVQAAGTFVLSDAAAVTIPEGALFWVRYFVQNTSGLPYFYSTASSIGNGYEGSGTSVSDKTLTGTITGDSAASHPPCLVVGQTRKSSFLVIGDSVGLGANDTEDYSGDQGIVNRSIGPYFGYTNVCDYGEKLTDFIGSHTNRAALAAYVSDVIIQHNVNDLGNSRTVAQIQADVQTIIGYFSGKKIHRCTATPETTSTDSWATVANQTAVFGTILNDLNSIVRSREKGVTRVLDVSAPLENVPLGRKYTLAFGVPTTDGTHPTQALYLAVQRAQVIRPDMFAR